MSEQQLGRVRPKEFCRLINSTPLGRATSSYKLERDREAAGLRMGSGQFIDFARYVAWKLWQRHTVILPRKALDPYAMAKERARARELAKAHSGRNITEYHKARKPARKRRAKRDFEYFCKAYFPETFKLPWSKDHLKVIQQIEEAILRGGLFAMAMPRGSGKTTLCECACLWAVLYGHRQFVALIGSDEGHAEDMLDAIKMELANNDNLFDDFGEVCVFIRALDGISNRCAGQMFQSKSTNILWASRKLVLPTIPKSKASAAIIKAAGLTGGFRGMKHKRPDGGTVRPTLVILDDPQTDESARSVMQCATREAIIAGAALGLAGPGVKISGIMPCTVICPGDMADRMLDREKHPDWQGTRTKMLYSLPTNETLWARYAELREDSLRNDMHGEEATEFYREHREAMDAGAVVAWPERYNHDELSAIQHAMNLRLRDLAAFMAEYQNEPLPPDGLGQTALTSDQVCEKINGYKRGLVPIDCTHLTAFIDVQQSILFYLVAGWAPNFTGYVLDYGAWPDQGRAYFSLSDVQQTLESVTGADGLEGAVYKALNILTTSLLGREWEADSGGTARIGRCMIDANWGNSTDVIYKFCRQSPLSGMLTPSHGRGIKASDNPLNHARRKPGERVGTHWRMPVPDRRSVRYAVYDTNWWKSFVTRGLRRGMGEPGCISIFGTEPGRHRMLGDHVASEYSVSVTRKDDTSGREVDEWKMRPGRPDNHWLDCLVGCAVAASMSGCDLINPGRAIGVRQPDEPRLNARELWAKARGR